MARHNQGVFKNLKERYNDLEKKYTEAMAKYFLKEEWNENYDFFSDFAYTADLLYRDAGKLELEINNMLSVLKFEDGKKKQDYEELSKRCKKIKDNIKCMFDTTLQQISYGVGLSEEDKKVIDGMSIYY